MSVSAARAPPRPEQTLPFHSLTPIFYKWLCWNLPSICYRSKKKLLTIFCVAGKIPMDGPKCWGICEFSDLALFFLCYAAFMPLKKALPYNSNAALDRVVWATVRANRLTGDGLCQFSWKKGTGWYGKVKWSKVFQKALFHINGQPVESPTPENRLNDKFGHLVNVNNGAKFHADRWTGFWSVSHLC